MSTAFKKEDYRDSYAEGMERHWWTFARARIVRRAIEAFPRVPILDVGCGPGLTVSFLRRRGYDVTGCELGEPIVRSDVRDHVLTGVAAQSLDLHLRESIELILLLDVLEHIECPEQMLDDLIGAFPNLKGIILTVPARMELWSAWDERYGHFRRYDLHQASNLFRSPKFQVISARYFFHALYPIMWLATHISKRATAIAPPRKWIWAHKIVGLYFILEKRLLRGDIPGTSVLVVARCGRPSS